MVGDMIVADDNHLYNMVVASSPLCTHSDDLPNNFVNEVLERGAPILTIDIAGSRMAIERRMPVPKPSPDEKKSRASKYKQMKRRKAKENAEWIKHLE